MKEKKREEEGKRNYSRVPVLFHLPMQETGGAEEQGEELRSLPPLMKAPEITGKKMTGGNS